MFGVLELEVCWESDLKIKVGEECRLYGARVPAFQRLRFLPAQGPGLCFR